MKTLGKKLTRSENTIEAFACWPCMCDACNCAPDEPAGQSAINAVSSSTYAYYQRLAGFGK